MTWHNFMVFFLSLVLCVLPCCCVVYRNGLFYDAQGREITFHGTNVVVKVPPYMPNTHSFDPITSLCEEDLKNIK